MDAVYTAGSLCVAAEDHETKALAARLQIFGFLRIEEIEPGGTARRLRPSEAVLASLDRPWRLTKPSYGSPVAVSIGGGSVQPLRR